LQKEPVAASGEYSLEDSTLGRVVVANDVPAGFAVFYTTIDFDGRLTHDVAGELTRFIHDRFGITASLNTCTQVHGKSVARAHRAERWRECDSCDALVTSERHVALGIKVADCLPIAMIDPTNEVMANVHSGWRGTVQQITAATVDELLQSTAFDPREAHAYLGPSIRSCCFEVGEEVASQFDAAYVDRRRAKPHVDLARLTADVLRERGFRADRIHDSRLCTRCEGSIFHSFRRDGKGGRNLALAAH